MDKDKLVKVLNRDNGSVVYSIPELNGLLRVYQAGEIKEIPFGELQQLSYIPGGKALLEDSLVIQDAEAVKELLGEVEPEYNYGKAEIIKLMKQGSLDQFLDCLDFAPEGVQDLIKTLSVELPLNDVAKRQAIYQKLNFNVDNAIRIQKESEEPAEKTVHKRRVVKSQSKSGSTSGRRVIKSE